MNKHNAQCPICKDSWSFNASKAKINEDEKNDLMKNGNLNVVCEDCCNNVEDFDDIAIELGKRGRVLSFAV